MSRPAPLWNKQIQLSDALLARIDQRAQEAHDRLARKVTRSAVIRAALVAWLEDAGRLSLEAVIQQITVVRRSEGPVPHRLHAQYWPEEMARRIAEIADEAQRALGRHVSPGLVVRIALAWWFKDADQTPEVVVQAIGAALLKPGMQPES